MQSLTHPGVESDTDALENLDWDVPCCIDWHPEAVPAAEWAVWTTPKACGHPRKGFLFLCEFHWTNKHRQPLYCATCLARRLLGDSIAQAVRL